MAGWGIEGGGAAPPPAHCPPGRLFRRARLLFTSTCSTGTSRGQSLRVSLVPFIPEGGDESPPRRGGNQAGENLSLTWSVASGIYSLNPDEAGVWGGLWSRVLGWSPRLSLDPGNHRG